MVSPIFLPTVPDRNPRTEWGCQPVTLISSWAVAPLARFSRSRTLAVLLALRTDRAFFAPFGVFFTGLAFLAALAFGGATWRARFPTLAFFVVGFGASPAAVACAALVASVIEVMFSPLVVISAVTTWITRVPLKCKSNLHRSGGDGIANGAEPGPEERKQERNSASGECVASIQIKHRAQATAQRADTGGPTAAHARSCVTP